MTRKLTPEQEAEIERDINAMAGQLATHAKQLSRAIISKLRYFQENEEETRHDA